MTNALAALAAASVWGIGAREAAEVLPRLTPASMRGEVLRFEEGFTVINDCYNSSPAAMVSMIDLLAEHSRLSPPHLGRGEMLELGATSAELHRECGPLRRREETRLDYRSAGRVRRTGARGSVPRERTRYNRNFSPPPRTPRILLLRLVRTGRPLILVKGSRGVRMERIIEAIRAKHELSRRSR